MMKLLNNKTYGAIVFFMFILIFTIAFLCNGNVAEAQSTNTPILNYVDGLTIEQVSSQNFNNANIADWEYLYNLDNSADYIYVTFDGGGYAVFNKYTLEMLEYAPYGCLPYEDDSSMRYYAGPVNYLQKENNSFEDIITGQIIDVSLEEANVYAQQMRTSLCSSGIIQNVASVYVDDNVCGLPKYNTNNKNAKVASDDSSKGDPIPIRPNSSGKYIDNFHYFLEAPLHGYNYEGGNYGNNNSGTCGPVAAQLLLSYNNYYNDRRIIEDRFLYGYDDATGSVTNYEWNPNYCEDPMSMTPYTLGSRSEDTGTNSFYSYVVTSIMEPGQYGSDLDDIKSGIQSILDSRIGRGSYSIVKAYTWFGAGWTPIDSQPIKNEINEGYPLIITTGSNLGWSNHQMVCYGYQDYTYPNGNTYSGYVVHYGWQGDTAIWINSAWCDGYLTLRLNHNHTYTYNGGKYNEEKCICGYRQYALDLSNITFDEVTISGYDGNWSGDIVIPGTINGRKVNISNALFANNTEITSVSISCWIEFNWRERIRRMYFFEEHITSNRID